MQLFQYFKQEIKGQYVQGHYNPQDEAILNGTSLRLRTALKHMMKIFGKNKSLSAGDNVSCAC